MKSAKNEPFKKSEQGIIIKVKIIPNSSENKILFKDDAIKVKVTAPAIENKANKALIEMISKKLKIAKKNINIIKGELNKEKTLLISNIDEDYLKEKFILS